LSAAAATNVFPTLPARELQRRPRLFESGLDGAQNPRPRRFVNGLFTRDLRARRGGRAREQQRGEQEHASA
jgi:hypothetical protein